MATIKASAIPRMIYGTAWKQGRTQELVYQALASGFRGIDTAAQPKHYQEDLAGAGIRQALQDGVTSRRSLYIQTKFTSVAGQDLQRMPYNPDASLDEQIRTSIASSLHNLRYSETEAPYLDCVLLHSPLPKFSQTLEAWRVLESYVPHSIKSLGISNVYSLSMLEALYNNASVKPSVVQNRFCEQTDYGKDIRAFCAKNDIVYQSFWTLTANPHLLASTPVTTLARELSISSSAALYNLVIGLGNVSVLNGTTNSGRMQEDLAAIEAMETWTRSNPELQIQLQSEMAALLD